MSYLSIIVIIAPTVNFVEYTIIQNLCISLQIFFGGGGGGGWRLDAKVFEQ